MSKVKMDKYNLKGFKSEGIVSVLLEKNGEPNAIVFNFSSGHQLEVYIDDMIKINHWIPDPEWLLEFKKIPLSDNDECTNFQYGDNSRTLLEMSMEQFGVI